MTSDYREESEKAKQAKRIDRYLRRRDRMVSWLTVCRHLRLPLVVMKHFEDMNLDMNLDSFGPAFAKMPHRWQQWVQYGKRNIYFPPMPRMFECHGRLWVLRNKKFRNGKFPLKRRNIKTEEA